MLGSRNEENEVAITAINKSRERNMLERCDHGLSLGYATFEMLVRIPYNTIN